jgi:hypothetical protein
MFAKTASFVTFAFALGLYLEVPAAQAKTYKGTFVSSGEAIGVFPEFSFNGSTTNAAVLNTFFGTDSLGDVGPGQGVSQIKADATKPSCMFKGLSGATESGKGYTLVGSVAAGHASGGPLFGDTFTVGSTATGCFSTTTGDFAGTETDLIVGGTGANKNATGSLTYSVVGVTLSAPAAPPAMASSNGSS